MNKLILFLSFLSLGILVVLSVYAPESAALWLASTAQGYNILRICIMAVLAILLVTTPPRSTLSRAAFGVFAMTLGLWSLSSTYANQMQILDGASLLTASIAIIVEVLERAPQEVLSRGSSRPAATAGRL
jgi:hypothetical protein